MKRFFLACLLILITTAAANAQGTGTYVALDLGPDIVVKPSGGGTLFMFGPEFGTQWVNIPVLVGFKSGLKAVYAQPRFKYDIELSALEGLIISPFAGVNANMSFFDAGDKTLFGFELGIAAGVRAYYFFTPNIGAFLEPVGLNFNFFRTIDGNTNSDLVMTYRLLFGAAYRF